MRWWWFGPAVTKPQRSREMQLMKDGGIGGFEVQPVYPLALDDADSGIKNLEFLSPEFLDALGLLGGQGQGAWTAFRPDAGERLAVRGPGVPDRRGGGTASLPAARFSPGQPNVGVPSLRPGEKLVAAFLIAAGRCRRPVP